MKDTPGVVEKLQILAISPPGFAGVGIAIAAHRAGYAGGVGFEHAEVSEARRVVDVLVAARADFSLFVPRLDEAWWGILESAVGRGLARVILTEPSSPTLGDEISRLHALGVAAVVQATCVEHAIEAESFGADGVIAKGSESGGRVGEETAFVLLQRIASRVRVPIFVRGGVGLNSSAACLAGGAAGVVLDWQLAMCGESEVPDAVKARIARMDGSETAILGQELDIRFRAYTRPGESSFTLLKEMEESIPSDDSDSARSRASWVDAAERRIRGEGGEPLLLFGQDAVFAARLAEQFQTVKGVCDAITRSASHGCRLAAGQRSLRPGGPLASSHGTRFPIVQGPMTRVSDTADFAMSVARGGGLPFLALALLRGPQVAALLEETKHKLGSLPWGVGILGFVPRGLRDEQLAEVRKHPPPYAIIAGGRPDQAAELERENIHTYLHIPSPALLKMYLEGGVRRVIFEGRECGGHVGPRSSFVLWEQMIAVILDHLSASKSKGEEYHVLFAGGIHDAVSASMVAAMAAPLCGRGVRIGVLLGTSYLFTTEAVSSGAIVEGFQKEALTCTQTILLESGVGHATRCADTPFGSVFLEEKRRLIREGRSKEEIREALETLNLGRLRIASKGLVRSDDAASAPAGAKLKSLDDQAQRLEGMYMIGQVAALRDRVCTIEELHDEVSRGGAERLQRFAEPARRVTSGGEANPSDVAIIGMSCLFPKAANLRRFWENILNKVDAIGEIPADRWDWKAYFDADRSAPDKIYSKWGGFLDDVLFDPTSFGMPPNSLPSVEPLQLLVLEAVREALRDSGYVDRPFNRERTAVVLGAGGGVADLGLGYGFRALLPYFMSRAGGSADDAAALIERLDGALPEWTEDSFAGLLMNVAAGRVANRFDLGGSNYTVDAACASSLAAVRLGVNELETGAADLVIVGGADTMQSPFAYLCFSKTQALSPTGQCRTFDAAGDGIVISEGIAFAILKRLSDAERDGDRIYAVIKGVGSSSDGRDRGLTAPRPAGQIRALERAYEKAGYSPQRVGLVEAHGTGTVAGDQSEVESLTRTFTAAGASNQNCALGSVKSMIGHTKCTAGVAGLVKAALALHHKVLPPTNGVKQPNPKAKFSESPFYINAETRPWLAEPDGAPRRAGVSAFGFGGTNFHAALEEYRGPVADSPPSAFSSWPAELFVWRAESPQSIADSLQMISAALAGGAVPRLADLAAAVCAEFAGGSGKCCLAIAAASFEDLTSKLSVATAALRQNQTEVRDPKGIYYGCRPLGPDEKIAFLFPGQGSQSVNMLRDLAIALPGVREVFEEADRSLGSALGRRLSSFIFPRPTFTREEASADEVALTQTQVAQPAIGAADLAMFRVLESLGIRADMVAGHSYGEYAALSAAGVWSLAELMRVSEARGRLIGEAGKANPGTMAAVDADEASVASALNGVEGVWIANLNSPSQTVISGGVEAVDAALRRISERGLTGRRIKVSCAFHSGLVTSAQSPFREVLEGVGFAPPRMAVYSNTTGRVHEGGGAALRDRLVEHLVRPVRFADEIATMHEAGARVFVEVGPGRVLSGLAEKTPSSSSVVIVSTDQAGRNGVVHLCHTLARLCSVGVGVQPGRLFAGRIDRVLPVRQLLETSRPSPPSATTWRVNGARAVPYNAPAKPVAAKPAKTTTSMMKPAMVSEQIVPVNRAPAPAPAVGAANDGVLSGYQALMSKFLETQKNVMLAYLQGGASPVSGSAVVSHVAAISTRAPGATVRAPDLVSEPVPLTAIAEPSPTVNERAETVEVGWNREAIVNQLVKIVSDRTGYPPEMLNLDLDMEADLGIDSIKRVEILGNLQNQSMLPGGSVDGDMEVLAKLKTLRAIVDWIVGRAEAAGGAAKQTPVVAPGNVASESEQPVARMVLRMGDAAATTQKPRAIPGVVLVVEDSSGLAEGLANALRERKTKVVVLSIGEPQGGSSRLDPSDRTAVATALERIRAEHGPIGGLVHLSGVRRTTPSPASWAKGVHADLHGLFNFVQLLESNLRGQGGSFLVVRRMDGEFATAGGARFNPIDAAASGLVKSVAREWSEVRCRTVDVAAEVSSADAVKAVLAELECDDGLTEVGYRDGKRLTLGVARSGLPDQAPAMALDASDVVLITGGARGITAEVAVELAQRFRCRLVLCGRSALPSEREAQATAGVTELKALKAVLRSQLEAGGEKSTPAAIESAYVHLLREREIRANLAAIRGAGSTVEYHVVDVADEVTFGSLIEQVYARFGRLDGVIHGAGVTEDKFIADKTIASFERVVRPKVDGACILASKLRAETLKFMVFFSSVSARYGNRGQSDYAAANEFLNKLAQWLNARWPGRVASLNWGPWESTGGMVSPELAKQFAKAGIQMISRAAGRRIFVDELLLGPKSDVEVVFGGPLEGAGAVAAVSKPSTEPASIWPLLNGRSRVIRGADGSVNISRELDPSFDLYLLDHQLDGKPVMPMAIGLELLCETAVSAAPADVQFMAMRDLHVLRGITLENGPRVLSVTASPSRTGDGRLTIELRAKTDGERPFVCYTATAEFSRSPAAAPPVEPWALIDPRPLGMSVEEAYEKWLFHGPLFAGIVDVERIGTNGIIARLSPSSPKRCLAESANASRWIIDPVIVDSGLQLLILWARTYRDMTPLPSRFGSFHRYGDLSAGEVRCEARIHPGADSSPSIHADLLFYDADGRLASRLEDMEVTCSKALNRLSHTRTSSAGIQS